MYKNYLLTESGIELGDGMKDTGELFEIAKRAKELYESDRLLEFEKYMIPMAKKRSKEDIKFLSFVQLNERPESTILSILGDIDYMKYGMDDYVLTEAGMVPRKNDE